jgi:hypothetical protein
MFNTKGQEVKAGGASKSLQPGVVKARIVSGQVRTSNKGDKKALELVLEGPQLPEPFEGWAINKDNPEGPKFKGQSAKVMATIWTDQFNLNDVNKNDILNKLFVIGKELGIRNSLDNISSVHEITCIEDWVKHALDLIAGNDIYFFLKGTEEEYNGKTIVKLSFPKYKFCSANQDKLDVFDKNNQYHYKALQTKSVAGFEAGSDDFNL